MDPDISFGDLEESGPDEEVRPDANGRYAVVTVGRLAPEDLPIFVDLDCLLDMEQHAQENTSVELGGLMFGGQRVDAEGRPFVVVHDSLRALHTDATKGSIKFTHETWQEISRLRDRYPDDMDMVGWYHTHPDWGVFLSGMDQFICNHFFNKPLDVALVIDPCRDDRGWFMWTGQSHHPLRRVGGFYLFASKFRQAELDHTAAQLEGRAMRSSTTAAGNYVVAGNTPPPVVHFHEQQPGWIGTAVAGLMVGQIALVLLVGLALMLPRSGADQELQALQAQVKKLEAREEKIEAREAMLREKTRLLDSMAAQIVEDPRNLATQLQEREDEVQRLREQADGAEQRRASIARLESRLKTTEADLEAKKKSLATATANAKAAEAKAKQLAADLKKAAGEDPAVAAAWYDSLLKPWVLGPVAALLGLGLGVGGATAFLRREDDFPPRGPMSDEPSDDRDRPESASRLRGGEGLQRE